MRIFRRIKRFFGRVVDGIRNLIRWFPIVWNDRDFDYWYFEKILAHKLKAMRDFHVSPNAMSMEAPEVAKQIDEVLALYDRLEKDDYVEEVDPEMHLGYMLVDDEVIYNDNRRDNEYIMSVYMEADKRKKADRLKLYTIMAENMENWWD